jgi:hypothetical protein
MQVHELAPKSLRVGELVLTYFPSGGKEVADQKQKFFQSRFVRDQVHRVQLKRHQWWQLELEMVPRFQVRQVHNQV